MAFFSLKIRGEKRARSIDLPHVLFPASVLRALKFHVLRILPYLYYDFKIPLADSRRNYLLLHTKYGEVLRSNNVTSSLKHFLRNYDPEIAKVTSMSLRASYATMMMMKYKEEKLFPHMKEDEFLQYLAKLMNTSEEQLKETYIASDNRGFVACAKLVSESFQDNISDSESE